MLDRSKIWIFNNAHFVGAVILATGLFWLALVRPWSVALFLVVFLFQNLYFLKGAKLVLGSFLAPLPFLFGQVFLGFTPLIATGLWLVGLILLWRLERVFWYGYLFLIALIAQFLLGNLSLPPLAVLGLYPLLIAAIAAAMFGDLLAEAVVKAIFATEALWLAFFLPWGFTARAIISFLALCFLVSRQFLPTRSEITPVSVAAATPASPAASSPQSDSGQAGQASATV